MESSIIATVTHLWQTWDIRVLMLISLLIQAILTSISPFRKRWANGLLNFIMWLLYLSADAVALYTIGLISRGQGDDPCICKGQGSLQKGDLLAFWAPFLLLHLGGPDTVTALALEDNELWHRHALELVTQVVITIYVFIQSIHRNSLWLPTVLMFLDGCIKYIERTCALYFASMDNFRATQRSRPEAGPNYARLMEEYSAALTANIPTEIEGKDGPKSKLEGTVTQDTSVDDHIQIQDLGGSSIETTTTDAPMEEESMVLVAFQFYLKFRGLLADSFLSLKDRDESRDFFLRKPAQDAFRIVEIELNFIYDAFYTKVFLLNRKRSYARIFCFLSVIGSLLFFFFKDKSDYHSIDIGITFALLWGALALDIIATIMFVWSNWWIVVSSDNVRLKSMASHLKCLRRWARNQLHLQKRSSESMSQYNLLTRCLNNLPSYIKFVNIRKIEDLFIDWKLVKTREVEDQLWTFIVEELQKKARLAADTTEGTIEVCSARGNLIFEDDYSLISEYLRPWTVNVDYDESVLTWHLATDLCYQTSSGPDKKQIYCKFSKKLSHYMCYLLLRQQPLVSMVVGASDTRFDDTCEEANKFIRSTLQAGAIWNKKQFCEKVLQVKAEVRPIIAKGDKSKSVLFDACRLANQLNMFPDKQWEITFKVWMEMLCYAAVRCSPRSHVAQLSKGGEFVTIVWLLMAHLGLGERFRQTRGFGWTKLVIHK